MIECRGRPLLFLGRLCELVFDLSGCKFLGGMSTEPLLKTRKARYIRLVGPLVSLRVRECVVNELGEIRGGFAKKLRKLLALQHLLFPLTVEFDRNALLPGFLPALLAELIEIAYPPDSGPWNLFENSTLPHLCSS